MPGCLFWCEAIDGNPAALSLYLRHYSSRKARRRGRRAIGAGKLFVGPGEKLVLISQWEDAVFAWRLSRFRQDNEAGVECTIFRNESAHRNSEMIVEAVRLAWKEWPHQRLFTFVDPDAIAGTNPGYCFKLAGWSLCRDQAGKPRSTATGKFILERLPDAEGGGGE
ncbi:MAG: hypothetical protein JO353_06435 [Phycisphaerae bacterium]|nr:hypothetical protein [Phycisphaerae bacterium]